MGRHLEMLGVAALSYFENSRMPAGGRHPVVATSRDGFNTGRCPGTGERHHRIPVERSLIRDPQPQAAVHGQVIRCSPSRSEVGRGESKDLEHRSIELPPARESGRLADGLDREVGLVEQAPGEVGPPRTSDEAGGGAGADGVVEQAAELPCRVPDPVRKLVLSVAVEESLIDQE